MRSRGQAMPYNPFGSHTSTVQAANAKHGAAGSSDRPQKRQKADDDSYEGKNGISIKGCSSLVLAETLGAASAWLAPALRSRCESTGLLTPTPCQAAGWPAVMSGRDLICVAKTGSGKTAAFLLPILAKLGQRAPGDTGIGAVVLGPTRELVAQIDGQAERFSEGSAIRCGSCYGGDGADFGQQLAMLASGLDLLIATPGRLAALVEKKPGLLRNAHMLVLDEADRLMEMGFESQVQAVVETMPASGPELSSGGRQTLLFTATWPDRLRPLATARWLLRNDPIRVAVATNDSTQPGGVAGVSGDQIAANANVKQVLAAVGETVILLTPPSTFSRCINSDGERASANDRLVNGYRWWRCWTSRPSSAGC